MIKDPTVSYTSSGGNWNIVFYGVSTCELRARLDSGWDSSKYRDFKYILDAEL